MDSINSRVSWLLQDQKIKKVRFAEALNISPAFVTELCAGRKAPSDRTIADICRLYSVNEIWLRTGVGEPYEPRSDDEEIMAALKRLMAGRPSKTIKNALKVVLSYDPGGQEWAVLEKIYNDIAAEAAGTDTEEKSET